MHAKSTKPNAIVFTVNDLFVQMHIKTDPLTQINTAACTAVARQMHV